MLGPTLLRPLLLLLPLVAVACGEESETSPFALWDHRIGMPLSELDSITLHDMDRRFTCVPVHDIYERCAIDAEGIPGQMRVVLDSLHRAVEFVFEPDIVGMQGRHATHLLRTTGEVRQAWDRAARGEQTGGNGLRSLSWSADAGRWTAEIRWLGNLPSLIRTTDERAIAGYRYAESLAPSSSPLPTPEERMLASSPLGRGLEMADQPDPSGPAVRAELQRLYHAQRVHWQENGRFARSLTALEYHGRDRSIRIRLQGDGLSFGATAFTGSGRRCRIWARLRPEPHAEWPSSDGSATCTTDPVAER